MKNVIHQDDPEKILNLYTLFIKSSVQLTLFTTKEESIKFTINNITDNNTLQIEYINSSDKEKLIENKLYNITCAMEGASYTFVSHYESNPELLSIASIITVIEKRAYERFGTEKFPKPYLKVNMHEDQYTFILCDLSQGGLAFLVSAQLAKNFIARKSIEIKEIGSKRFSTPIKAVIIHCGPYQKDNTKGIQTSQSFHKVGIQFSEIPNLD